MAAVNQELLRTLSDLWRSGGDATIAVDSGRVQRTLHIQQGNLVGAESDLLTERLGVQLVAEGKLEAGLVGPLVESARRSGRPFGEQLVAERLIESAELLLALERQLVCRFERTLQMSGAVDVRARSDAQGSGRRPVAAAIVAAFRRAPVELASQLVARLPLDHPVMREDLYGPEQLQLTATELRYFRQLATGMKATGVLDRAQDYDCALRLCAALVGLGAIATEKPDPIARYLRTA